MLERARTVGGFCKCGSVTHTSTDDKNCPLSTNYRPEFGELGFRGAGRGPDRAAMAAALKVKGIDLTIETSKNECHNAVQTAEERKVKLLSRLRHFQVCVDFYYL